MRQRRDRAPRVIGFGKSDPPVVA